MATFTTELHDIVKCDRPEDSDWVMIGLHDYPIFDESYRSVLNSKIARRYWNREIGCETVEQFRHLMRTKMHEIMPYYNELHASARMEFDPFETLRVETLTEGTIDTESKTDSVTSESGESTSHNSSASKTRTVNSEHPQTRLNNYEDYATASVDSLSESTADSSGTSEGTTKSEGVNVGKNTNRGTTVQSGSSGLKSDMLRSYRETILNIDVMIVDELASLFMQVWDAQTSFTVKDSQYYGWGGFMLW